MIDILLLTIFFLILLLGQLVKIFYKKHQQLIFAQKQIKNHVLQISSFTALQEKNNNLLHSCDALGHSITALHVQLEVAKKLWQINPSQAQESLLKAYQLSGNIMHEIRKLVKK